MRETPQDIGRTRFDEWCWRRGLELRDVVEGLQKAADALLIHDGRPRRVPSIETVRLIRLPFSDPRRRVPASDVMDLIHLFTRGAISPPDFYPPRMEPANEETRATAEVRA